ncbi:MAG TPA: hypothetical protein VJ063_11425, partial [Verrucomicrobiae bacterium]|nr:hypothetical protein [Verrucomicrobiae bacterium]
MRFHFVCSVLALGVGQAIAEPDLNGLATLRHFDATLTGAGVPVAQVEASSPGWEANPAAMGANACHMTWTCSGGSATNFPNALGGESGHANDVGRLFFSVAPGATRLENYEASYFASSIVPNQVPIAAKIVNQSFTYFARNTRVDREYDHYAARYNVLFVSGAGNGGWVCSPS